MDHSSQAALDGVGDERDGMAPDVLDRPAAGEVATRSPRPAIDGRVVAGVAVLVLVQQAWLIVGWFKEFVSDDWALLWAAADSWGRWQPEQPNFWGQAYGSTLESVPTQILHAAGVGYPLALPIVLTGAHLASWWIPGAAAWRRGHRFLALLAVAMPSLLSTEYVVAASVYGTAAGRFLGAVALALVILFPDRVRWVAAAFALAACAFLVDASSLLMTAPACVYGLVRCVPQAREDGWRRTTIVFLLALTPVGVWVAFVGWWYGQHPTDAMHPTAPFDPRWEILTDNLAHPERMFGPYALELLRQPYTVVAVVAVLGALVLYQRRLAPILALTALVVVTALLVSLGKTYDGLPSVYYLAARLLLPLPMGIWFVACCVEPLPVTVRRSRWPVIVLVAVVGLTASWRVITWSDRGGALEAQAIASDSMYPQLPVDRMMPLCDRVRDAAVLAGTNIAVFEDRIAAYGCAAVVGPSLTTVYPEYDRRRWVLESLDRPQDVDVVLYVGQAPGQCNAGETCTELVPGIWAITLAGRTPIQLIRDLGLPVRTF